MSDCKHPKKQRYPSEGAAIKALKHMPRHKAQHNYPYRCNDHWHIGRMTRYTLRRRKR